VIVLILVAVLWIAVLVPGVISKLSERRSAGSIDHFHQRLDLLQRAGPKLVEPAYRLTGTESTVSLAGPIVVAAPPPTARPSLALVPDDAESSDSFAQVPSDGPVDDVLVRLHTGLPEETEEAASDGYELSILDQRRLVAADRRQLARKRRRDVLFTLSGLAALTGLLGLVRPLRGAWIAAAVLVVLLLMFVGLAAYCQRAETEKRRMEQLRRADLARVVDDPLESGNVKYLSEADLADYYEAEDSRMAAEA
jgi:hypothetical protein